MSQWYLKNLATEHLEMQKAVRKIWNCKKLLQVDCQTEEVQHGTVAKILSLN